MLGLGSLVVLVAVYCVLGFVFAWVAQVVSREEVSVGAGIGIVVTAGIVAILTSAVLASYAGGLAVFLIPVVNFGLFTLLTNLIAKLSWKHSAIIAAIYTALLFVVGFALTMCAAAAS